MMSEQELTPHLEELKKVLKDKVDDETILKALNQYVNDFRLDINSAKSSIIRRYGGPRMGFVTADHVTKKIADLTGSEGFVDVTARVVFVEKKDVNTKNGMKTILSGIVGDETGTASFTDWSGSSALEKGETYLFKNCSVRMWNDSPRISINNADSVSKSDKAIEVKSNYQAQPMGDAVTRKIDEMDGTERNLDFVGKIVFKENKDVIIKGEKRSIISGIVGDETGTASFTIWRPEPDVERGKVYQFKSCYARKWNERVQINVGNNGTYEPVDREVEVPSRPMPASEAENIKIGNIKENTGNLNTVGRVMSVQKREIVARGEPRTVYSGVLADETGQIQFSSWKEFPYQKGDTVSLKNAYIRSWKSIPQINIGDNTEIEKTADIEIAEAEGTYRTVGDIVKNGGGMDIIVKGPILEVKNNSGIVHRCPTCRRAVLDNECKTCGTVEPYADMRLICIVDDGTGAISVSMGRDLAEKVSGIKFDQALGLFQARGNELVLQSLKDKVIFKRIAARGSVMINDEFGPNLTPSEISEYTADVTKDTKDLLGKMEEML